MVGMSGKYAVRLTAATASGRIAPDLMCGATTGSTMWKIGVCPPSTDCIAGAAPWNGTWVISALFSSWNSQVMARCGVVP